MAAANSVGTEGNEAREEQHHTMKAFGDAPQSLGCVLWARPHFGEITTPCLWRWERA